MPFAVIDMGTNTFNLLIGEKEKGHITKIVSERIPVKLGEGSINLGYIAAVPFERGINAILSFHEEIERRNVNQVIAIATSAIRSAENGKEFAEQVFLRTGIKTEIIDGEKEALFIYKGVREAVNIGEKLSLIMDIGGGSVEFILCDDKHAHSIRSYPIGVARLMSKFNPENPISEQTIHSIYAYWDETLSEWIEQINQIGVEKLIGSSGAFDSIMDMVAAEFDLKGISEDATAYTINLFQFERMFEKTIRSTTEEREKMKGLIAMRVDMIVLSYLFVNYIIRKCHIKELVVSTYSLKEGVIAEMIKGK